MSPRAAAGFFSGIHSGFQARSNQAAAQQAAQEKLRTHMLKVKDSRDSLQNQIGDDARTLITEFNAADPETMKGVQDKMWNLVQTTEDKSMLPEQMLDGSYGLPVYGSVADAMVPEVSAEGIEKQGQSGFRLSRPDPAEATRGLQGPAKGGGTLDKSNPTSRAYQKLKSARGKEVDKIRRGGGAPVHVRAGYGSEAAMIRGQAKKTGHFNMLGILSNRGQADPSVMINDEKGWASAKDQFYVWAEGAGMPGKDAKAVVDRFEKDRTDMKSGKDSIATKSTKLLDGVHKYLADWFEVDAGIGGITSKLEGMDKMHYLGAINFAMESILVDPNQTMVELQWSVMGILAGRGEVDGEFDFKLAQMSPDLADIGRTGKPKPDFAVEAETEIPGSRYDQVSHTLSYIHPVTGKIDYIVGDKLIAKVARQNKVNNEKFREEQIIKQEEDKKKVEAFVSQEKARSEAMQRQGETITEGLKPKGMRPDDKALEFMAQPYVPGPVKRLPGRVHENVGGFFENLLGDL